jgi:hypothetical protein
MTKKPRGDIMPFHNFTGAVRIKTGDTVSESKNFKIHMQYKDTEDFPPKFEKKRAHKYYSKQPYDFKNK